MACGTYDLVAMVAFDTDQVTVVHGTDYLDGPEATRASSGAHRTSCAASTTGGWPLPDAIRVQYLTEDVRHG